MPPGLGLLYVVLKRLEELEYRCSVLLREARRYREERDRLQADANEADWAAGRGVN